jgi:methylmalonyl-CoA mutase N-terminal domain/subunit
MWAKIMKDLGATDDKAMALRFHTQTGGSTLTAQQPFNNISRVTLQSLAAVLGGTQSLHTNGYDEALNLPTEEAASIALRTQQVIAFESGVAETADPLAGSFFVENLTNELEKKANEIIENIDTIGGSVSAIEKGYIQNEIAASAYEYQKNIENGSKIIIGVNAFTDESKSSSSSFRIEDAIGIAQVKKLKLFKNSRDTQIVKACLEKISDDAKNNVNLMPGVIEAVENKCTLGEIADQLRNVFGIYQQ